MNVSFNITPSTLTTSTVQDTGGTQQTAPSSSKTLTVSIASGSQGDSGVVQPTAITLSYPLIGPEDVALNEVAQQLKNLDLNQLAGMTTTAAVLLINQQVGELASAMVKGGPSYIKENAESLTSAMKGIEEQAARAETFLFDLINNSTYPDFNEFLSKMLTAAQELRELASAAKHNLVMAQYENVLDQSKQMEIAAQKNYESTMKEIEASKTEAIGKIISGSLSILATAAGGVAGRASSAGGVIGAQMGGGIGQSLGAIVEGGTGLAAASDRSDAAKLKLEADMAGAIQKKYEATQKLLQEAENITDELRDIGKTLADMVLKLYQDFVSNQSQIVQRSNI